MKDVVVIQYYLFMYISAPEQNYWKIAIFDLRFIELLFVRYYILF